MTGAARQMCGDYEKCEFHHRLEKGNTNARRPCPFGDWLGGVAFDAGPCRLVASEFAGVDPSVGGRDLFGDVPMLDNEPIFDAVEVDDGDARFAVTRFGERRDEAAGTDDSVDLVVDQRCDGCCEAPEACDDVLDSVFGSDAVLHVCHH